MNNNDTNTFSMTLTPDGDRHLMRVADTGHGIAPEHLPHVFEPFYTTKESGAGVGLGLAVVYGIVERHGGQIDVVSPPGAGTTFTAVLPLFRFTAKGEAEGQG